MFNFVNFEISGKCNANCEYCVSGKNSISGNFQQKNSSYIDLDKFKSAINYMFENKIISANSTIGLFNWGEPFLHPNFKEILSFLNKKDLNYVLSTNASKLIEFENFDLSNLKKLTFSMPGFSQKSYDLIHGFKFERIKNNIKKMLTNYRENGFIGCSEIAFHMYKFNHDEISLAQDFAKELEHLGLSVSPSAAYLNGYTMFKDYLSGNYTKEKNEEIYAKVYVSHYKKIQEKRPEKYICPQFSMLTVDESCNIIACCAADKIVYSQALVGNLFELNVEQINKRKVNTLICSECQGLGIDYLIHNPAFYDYKLRPETHKISLFSEDKEIVKGRVYLYGSGDVADAFLDYNRTYLSNGFEVVGILDSNPNKENEIYNGLVVTMPQKVEFGEDEMILIASQSELSKQDIIRLLTENLKIKNRILHIVKK